MKEWTSAEVTTVLSITRYRWGEDKIFWSCTYNCGPWSVTYNHAAKAVYLFLEDTRIAMWALPFVDRRLRRE